MKVKVKLNPITFASACLAVFFHFSSYAEQETYAQYSNRINSIKHQLRPGETLKQVLRDHGYNTTTHLYQTYLKNGIRPHQKWKLTPGNIIILPYIETKNEFTSFRSLASELKEKGKIPSHEYKEIETVSSLLAAVGVDFFSIDAVDKTNKQTASLISDAIPKLTLAWTLAWSKKWSTEFSFSYRKDKIIESSNSDKTLKKNTFARTGLIAGLGRHWSKNSRTLFFIARSERGFIRASSPTELEIDSAASIDLGIKHEFIFLRRKSALAGIDFMATSLGKGKTATYTTERGHFYQSSLFMHHQLKSVRLEGRMFYGLWEQDSPFVSQSAKESGTAIGLSWDFR